MDFAECSLSKDEARRRIIDLLSDMLAAGHYTHEEIKRLRALLRCWKYTLTHDEWVDLINDAVRVGAAKNGIFFGIFGTLLIIASLLPSTVKGTLSGEPHDRLVRHLINRAANEVDDSPSVTNKLLKAMAELSRGDVNWVLFRANVNSILLDLGVPDAERAQILQALNEYWTIEVGQQATDEDVQLRWTSEELKVMYALECSELLPGNMTPAQMRDLYLSTDRIDTDGLAADYAWQRYQESAGAASALSASRSRYDVTLQEIHYWILQDVYDLMDWCRNRGRDAQIGVTAITEDDILQSRLHDEIGDDVSKTFIDMSTSRVVSYHDVGVVPSVNDVSMVFGINPVVVIVEPACYGKITISPWTPQRVHSFAS